MPSERVIFSDKARRHFRTTIAAAHRQLHSSAVILVFDRTPASEPRKAKVADPANANMRPAIIQRRASSLNEAEDKIDDVLMAEMAEGNGAALGVLTERHGPRIAALAYRMLGPAGDCDEVVQETFLRLWKRAALWEPGRAKLSTWLHRVASNLAIDRLRRKSPVSLEEAPDVVDLGPRPDAAIEAHEAAASIDQALGSLAPRQKLAITLCHFQELSNIEAADIMGVSVDALESLLARGRRNLKEALMSQKDWLMDTVGTGHIAIDHDQLERDK